MPAAKWADPEVTAKGQRRAVVSPAKLETLWLNTGTLCNITCANCYIESSPRNDRLAYLTAAEARPFLDEAKELGAREIGLTGGEPFMNPELLAIVSLALERGFTVLVLTNAMAPMLKARAELLPFKGRVKLRVSLDSPDEAGHDKERGAGSFRKVMEGLGWLRAEGFDVSIAGRGEPDLSAYPPGVEVVVFPEMGVDEDRLPEITTECWDILGKKPESVMCASSRMVVKRKGQAPAVVACTLIPYDERFELGRTLREAWKPVSLQHPNCASFCVLGGASCSR